jgi:hypothetical protein
MNHCKSVFYGAAHALAVFVYVFAVSWLLVNGEAIFGAIVGLWGPLIMLLLFVLSAATTGTLVLARPIHLYVSGHKREAFEVLFYTLGFLFIILLLLIVARTFF